MEENVQSATSAEAQGSCLPENLFEYFSQFKFAKELAEAMYPYFLTVSSIYDKWDDSSADRFNEGPVARTRKISERYMKSLINLERGYPMILEEAGKLTNWNAGLGGFLSILDIGMLIDRQISRNLFGHDDFRL